jgi:hypothetical protein
MNPTTDLIGHRTTFPFPRPAKSDRTQRDAGHGTTPGGAHDTTSRCRLTAQLDREWRRLRRDERALRTARSWIGTIRPDGALASVLVDLDDLHDLVSATDRAADRPTSRPGHPHGHRPGTRRGDEILLELVALARHQQLAGRIVLQRILPGLLSRSTRYSEFQVGHRTADIVVASAWMAIHDYDHERRPRQVAAALISDAVFSAFRQPHRRRSATEQLRPIESWTRRPAAEPSATPIEELATVVAEARLNGVASEHLDLLRDLVRTGSSTVVAAELGVTDRTVRNRRLRAVEQVRQAVLAA